MNKKNKLLNIKPFYIIIAPIVFIAIIAIFVAIALIVKSGVVYDVCAEMLVAFALWLMPLGNFVCAMVGFKAYKMKKIELQVNDKKLMILSIIDIVLVIAPIVLVLLLS